MVIDVIINKAAIIERCIRRINEEYAGNQESLENYTKQDSIILNIQRACEACIDIAMHIVAEKGLGIPQNSRDAFDFLRDTGIIDNETSVKMKAMVGFRNIAVHDYKSININIVRQIIEKNIDDLSKFAKLILENVRKGKI